MTDAQVEAAVERARSDEFDLCYDGNFFTRPTKYWWMRGEPARRFDNVDEAKAYAVRCQMHAALSAAQVEAHVWPEEYAATWNEGYEAGVEAAAKIADARTVVWKNAGAADMRASCALPLEEECEDIAAAIRALRPAARAGADRPATRTDVRRLADKIAAADDVILYDERGSDTPLRPDEIDVVVAALAGAPHQKAIWEAEYQLGRKQGFAAGIEAAKKIALAEQADMRSLQPHPIGEAIYNKLCALRQHGTVSASEPAGAPSEDDVLYQFGQATESEAVINRAPAFALAAKILRCLKWHYGAEASDKDSAAEQMIAELIVAEPAGENPCARTLSEEDVLRAIREEEICANETDDGCLRQVCLCERAAKAVVALSQGLKNDR